MARQTEGRARPAAPTTARPPRARAPSVPAFGGWEVAAGGKGAAEAPDYSLDFTNIRAARMQRRTKALSWSSFVGDNAAVPVETPDGGEEKRQWSRSSSAAATSDGDDDDDDDDRERRQRHQHLRRLRSADIDDRQPIQPRRAVPKGRGKFKGYLFGCVAGQW